MLKLPDTTVTKPVKLIKDPEMKSLYESLSSAEQIPNVITLNTFREFEPLFRKDHGLTRDQIKVLSEKYSRLIDFYKETQIVVSEIDRTVVLTLPAIFTPVRSLDLTEQNAALVATNHGMAHHNVPKYSSDAFANMFNAIRNEQLKNQPILKQYREEYIATVTKFFELYSGGSKSLPIGNEPSSTSINENTTWDIE